MSDRIRFFSACAAIVAAAGIVGLASDAAYISAAPKADKKISSIRIKNAGKELLINRGEKKHLAVKVKPRAASGAVEWKSSKKSVVSVTKKGMIRGKRYGKSYIIVRAKDGSRKKAKLLVRVGRKVTGVELSSKSVSLDVRSSMRLSAKVSPVNATKRRLSYRSSNDSVATVSSTGVVYGKAKGSAVITAAARDASGKKAVCKVQVVVPSKSILLDSDEKGTRIEVGEKFTINAIVQPADASNQGIRFTSLNPRVARVSQSGVVTGVDSGTTTVLVQAADGRSSARVELEVYKMELRDEKLVAHRGFSSEAPENTTAAFELAVQKGFYGVECDVRKTLDDNFVIMHDPDIGRMCGSDKNLTIAHMDLELLKRFPITAGSNVDRYSNLTVPTLDEYLEILSGSETVHPFIELKEPFAVSDLQKIVQKVKRYGLLARTYFISCYKENLLSIREIDGVNREFLQYVYGAESSNRLQPVDESVISWCIANAIDLDARHTLISASNVYRLHEAGRKVNVWTVNDLTRAFDLVTNARVDMVTTEYYLNSI